MKSKPSNFNKKLKNTALMTLLCSVAYGAHAQDLLQTYQIALEQDPALKQALAQSRALQQGKPLAFSALLPQVNVTGTSSSQEPILLYNSTSTGPRIIKKHGYSLTGTQSLVDLNSWFNLSQAEHIYDKAGASYVSSEQSLIIRTAQAYFDVLNAFDNLTFTQAEKNSFEQQLRQTEEKFNVGLVAITDLHDFRARYDESVANEITAQNALDDAKERLKQITGQSFVELAALETDFPLDTPQPQNLDEWVGFAEKNNPTLMASRYNMQAYHSAVTKEKANHLPKFSLESSYGKDRTGIVTNPGDDSDTGWTVLFKGSMNIFAGGGIEANVRKSQYEYQDAREAYEVTRRETIANTRIAYRGVLSTMGTVIAFQQAVISAQSALQANEAAYDVGTKTAVDVLDAISLLYNQQRNLASARYNYILNLLKLKQAAGTLSVNDVQEVNRWLLPAVEES